MRSLMSVLFLMIFCSVQTASATEALNTAQSECCVEFSDVKIPVKLVTSYYWTSSSCPIRAIVFQTKAERKFCVDPETPWGLVCIAVDCLGAGSRGVKKRWSYETSQTVEVSNGFKRFALKLFSTL